MDDEESDNSSCGSDRQEWESPTKDIDLTASEDILGDEEDANDSDQLPYSQTSSCSNDSQGSHPSLRPSFSAIPEVCRERRESFLSVEASI